MYTSSGLKQDSKGNNYMQVCNTRTGEITRVDLEPSIPEAFKNVVLDTSKKAHIWNFSKESAKFEPSICGVFGCACCDIDNLEKRKARFLND